MNKIEFLGAVAAELHALPPTDMKDRIGFLSEMIDDRIEEGLTEEAVIAEMGTPAEVAARILADSPASAQAGESAAPPKKKKRKRPALRTALLIASPIFASLLLAVSVALFCVIVTLLALAVSFFAVTLPCYLIFKGSWIAAKWLYGAAVVGVKALATFFDR